MREEMENPHEFHVIWTTDNDNDDARITIATNNISIFRGIRIYFGEFSI